MTPGPTTEPLPEGVTTMVVTLLRASESFAVAPGAVLWQQTIHQQSLIAQVAAMVDSLWATTATQGCTESNVILRLDFMSPTEHATLDEDSPCARATLIIDGTPGPVLASSLISSVEQLVGVQASTGPDGQVAVWSRPSAPQLASATQWVTALAKRAGDPAPGPGTAILTQREAALQVITPGDTGDSNQAVILVVVHGKFDANLILDHPPGTKPLPGGDVLLASFDANTGKVMDLTILSSTTGRAAPDLSTYGPAVPLPSM